MSYNSHPNLFPLPFYTALRIETAGAHCLIEFAKRSVSKNYIRNLIMIQFHWGTSIELLLLLRPHKTRQTIQNVFSGVKLLSILLFTCFELDLPLIFFGYTRVHIFIKGRPFMPSVSPNRNPISVSMCISYKTHSTVRAASSSRESSTAATLSGWLRASLTRLPVRVSV